MKEESEIREINLYDDRTEKIKVFKKEFSGADYLFIEVGVDDDEGNSTLSYLNFKLPGGVQLKITNLEYNDELEMKIFGSSERKCFIDAFRYLANKLEEGSTY